MKKGALLLMLFIALFLVGCGDNNSKEEKNMKYDKLFKEASEIYYLYYMKSIGMTHSEITLDMLKTASENSDIEFNIKELIEKCELTSMVTVVADENREIADYILDYKCGE